MKAIFGFVLWIVCLLLFASAFAAQPSPPPSPEAQRCLAEGGIPVVVATTRGIGCAAPLNDAWSLRE